jgi:outer membrane protein OmpA-like peptidoglycan-associated protein
MKKKIVVITMLPTLLLSLSLSTQAQASNKVYQASLSNSNWYLSAATPIQCRLTHIIPKYGEAAFDVRANRKINLDFFLQSRRATAKTTFATLKSVPPIWRAGEPAHKIATIKFHQQFDGYVTHQNAWQMLSELESGQQPTFYFKDWYDKNNVTTVGLSTVNFAKSFNEFNNCISQLLPYDFNDIAYSILKYDKKGVNLTRFSKKRLKMIGDYIKHDEHVQVIVVSGYTDSYGPKVANQIVSEERANSIKDYLASLGLEDSKIQVNAFGEKQHIADNREILGREQNRRVIISIEQEDLIL